MNEPSIPPSSAVERNRPRSRHAPKRRRRYSFVMRYSSLAALMGLCFLLWPRPADVPLGSSPSTTLTAAWPFGLEFIGLGFLFAMLLFSAFAVTAAIRHTWRRPRHVRPVSEPPAAVPALPVTRTSVAAAKEAKETSASGETLNDEQLQRLNFQRWRYEHGQLTEFPSAPLPPEE
jgi:hypothetical protein